MKIIPCIIVAATLATACGSQETQLGDGSSVGTVRSSDAAAAKPIPYETKVAIELNRDGQVILVNHLQSAWSGKRLLGNQQLALVPVE